VSKSEHKTHMDIYLSIYLMIRLCAYICMCVYIVVAGLLSGVLCVRLAGQFIPKVIYIYSAIYMVHAYGYIYKKGTHTRSTQPCKALQEDVARMASVWGSALL